MSMMVDAVFAILISMSVISWAIIMWKIMIFYKERKAISDFSKPNGAKSSAANTTGRYAVNAITRKAYEIQSTIPAKDINEYRDMMSMHLFHVLDEIKGSMDKGLPILASIGSTAAFVGLFGTVWGIHETLVGISGINGINLQLITKPMGEALMATAAGIAVAVPAIIAYNAFSRSSHSMAHSLRNIIEYMVAYTRAA